MNYQNKILWHQGQFLQAAHFQQQERYFESLVTTATHAITSLNYGVSNIAIDQELLKTGKVAITAISGIMPDGTPFNVPHNDIITNILETDLTHQKKSIIFSLFFAQCRLAISINLVTELDNFSVNKLHTPNVGAFIL